ncbi:hypothetical protein RRG08_024314 [Elysia crispata]|uniref:Uncharacterized protein n=1 Tax=Elysia crispata TaxID=231223 RepID=A0AAE1DRR6_9GAST|nr:hypothetical protein RRG08_024314 [Elysia crispata]
MEIEVGCLHFPAIASDQHIHILRRENGTESSPLVESDLKMCSPTPSKLAPVSSHITHPSAVRGCARPEPFRFRGHGRAGILDSAAGLAHRVQLIIYPAWLDNFCDSRLLAGYFDPVTVTRSRQEEPRPA